MAGRKSKRVRTIRRVSVGFLGANTRFSGDLVDLSKTGLLMRSSEELEPETLGRIGIEIGLDVFRSVVKVRRRVPHVGIAFQFMQMSPHDRELLHRLLLSLEGHLGK